VPKEVKEMIDGYIQNLTAQSRLGILPSWQLPDIQVGIPIEEYYIQESLLDTCGNDLPIRELLIPANIWTFPVRAHDKYLYYVEIAKGKDGKWDWNGAGGLGGGGPENWWQKLRKSYPESTGINPILICDGLFKYLYFPQKSPRNLFYIKYGNEQFDFARNSSNSMDSLDDSRILVPHLKKNWKDGQAFRDAYNKKHPGTFKNNSTVGGEK
jgi:hypothetical protein